MEFGVRTDRGRVRNNNEDSYRIAPELSLFILSDGMGGQASGEVASRITTDTILAHCRESNFDSSLPLVGERMEGASEASNHLVSAVRLANAAVHNTAQRNENHRGMGATVVAVWINGDRMSVVHVGDSRAYRLRNGEFEQLTEDHSFVAEQVRHGAMTAEQAGHSTLQNVLLRALGADSEVEVELDEELVIEGDTVLLCSDGLSRELSDAQIAAVLREAEDAQEAADCLIDLANHAGGEDNITVIVVRPAARPVGAFARIGKLGRWFAGSS
jgi:serine/threonine protein phosphatase PrpC